MFSLHCWHLTEFFHGFLPYSYTHGYERGSNVKASW